MSEKRDLQLRAGDRNQYGFTFEIPSIDETSFMATFLTRDEDLLNQSWTGTYVGQHFSVRYFIYTRPVFVDMPVEKATRV